ncbi:probable transposable element [Lasallia pustulata]|uniref:Probable transposable element n=1 Tax=Lasallia pustulata TaxID=136370 RepID=A0A1W5DDJ8_9LECA|nr:probable transposable element [Lasallia pustulata]
MKLLNQSLGVADVIRRLPTTSKPVKLASEEELPELKESIIALGHQFHWFVISGIPNTKILKETDHLCIKIIYQYYSYDPPSEPTGRSRSSTRNFRDRSVIPISSTGSSVVETLGPKFLTVWSIDRTKGSPLHTALNRFRTGTTLLKETPHFLNYHKVPALSIPQTSPETDAPTTEPSQSSTASPLEKEPRPVTDSTSVETHQLIVNLPTKEASALEEATRLAGIEEENLEEERETTRNGKQRATSHNRLSTEEVLGSNTIEERELLIQEASLAQEKADIKVRLLRKARDEYDQKEFARGLSGKCNQLAVEWNLEKEQRLLELQCLEQADVKQDRLEPERLDQRAEGSLQEQPHFNMSNQEGSSNPRSSGLPSSSNHPFSGNAFSVEQIRVLSQLFDEKLRLSANLQGPSGPPDLGFFHPDVPESYGTGNVIFNSKETIYREVYTFIKRVEDYALLVGEEKVAENLSTCLRGNTLNWYLQELDDFTRQALQNMPLTEFSSKLAKRFKMTMTKALEQLNKEHYSLLDAHANREPQGYLQNMMRYAQAAGVTDLLAQLTWAWQGLDIELQTVTAMPRSRTTLQEFSEELERIQNDKSGMIEPKIGSIAPQTAVKMEIETGIEIGTIDQLTDHQNKVGLTFITEEDKDIKDIKAFKAFLVTLPMVLGLRRTTDPFINLPVNRTEPRNFIWTTTGYPGPIRTKARTTSNHSRHDRGFPKSVLQQVQQSRVLKQQKQLSRPTRKCGYHNQEAHNYHGSQMDHFDGTYPGNSEPLQDVQNENHSLNPSQSKMDVIEGQENKPPGPNIDANYTDAYHIEIPPKPLAYTCCDCRTKGKRVRITNRTQSSDQENQAKVGISEPAGSLVNGPETTAAEVGAHLVFSESSSPKVVHPVVESDAPTIAGNVDSTVPFICVKNSSWKEKILPRHTRVGTVTEYEEEECYPVDVEDHSLAAKYTPVEVDVSKPETKLANGVTIYGDAETVAVLADVINVFPRTWSDSGNMVNITPEEHLSIPLTVDWNTSTAAKLSHWVYLMGPNERAVINEEFDKMHEQGRISEKKPTKKGRVVVDIRGLKKITTTDAYLIPLQSEIISAVHGSKFISTMDCTGFFHQWPVKEEDRHKLTVVSHRGSERFNMAVIGFKNSPPYIQQKMDNLLRPFKSFAKEYIDDIVVFSRNLAEHAAHLQVLLELFQNARISLKGTKSFIGYPSATLLGQRVDRFGYSTAEEKIAALRNLKFPATLNALEIYLGMTGWLRQFVAYYAQILEPLQYWKTELL